MKSNACLSISRLFFSSVFSKPLSFFGNFWKELLNGKILFWLHSKCTSWVWLSLCGPMWSLWSCLWWLGPEPRVPAFLWAPGSFYLEYTSPGVSVPSFPSRTHLESRLEWDVWFVDCPWWSAALKPASSPGTATCPDWHHCGVLLCCVTVHISFLPGQEQCVLRSRDSGNTCWMSRENEYMRLLREFCTWERVTLATEMIRRLLSCPPWDLMKTKTKGLEN